MRFGLLDLDPADNPGILDTATWDSTAAWAAVSAEDDSYWESLAVAAAEGRPLADGARLFPRSPSAARDGGRLFFLVAIDDGQQAFVEIGPEAEWDRVLGTPLGTRSLAGGRCLSAYPADAATIDRFTRYLNPARGPRALGPVPRLGIGTRMTTAVWPAIWRAMAERGFAANAIQNSVRELNLLADILAGKPPDKNVAFNFGTIESGYTGSTFEGLWVAGVLHAVGHAPRLPGTFGADADHIQVKRGTAGLARAHALVEVTRYYSFYTLDVSDVLDYAALNETSAAGAEARLAAVVPDGAQRRALLAYHGQARRVAGEDYALDAATIGRLAGKYWNALHAVEALVEHVRALKDGVPFDLEISIDEHPAEVPTFNCLTGNAELTFILLEARRRGLPLTHVAPNYGVEKGVDYSCPDGLPGLERRARQLGRIAEEFGVMADFHSGDDLSAATRRAIARATGGRLHFKVSPMLQLLFGEVLETYHPALFRRWWEDALAYARREATSGSAFAAACVRAAEARGLRPAAHDEIFHHFSFAFIGRRDPAGQFMVRDEFYRLSPGFYAAYQERIARYLVELAEDLFVKA